MAKAQMPKAKALNRIAARLRPKSAMRRAFVRIQVPRTRTAMVKTTLPAEFSFSDIRRRQVEAACAFSYSKCLKNAQKGRKKR